MNNEQILEEIKSVKKELQDIRSILEQNNNDDKVSKILQIIEALQHNSSFVEYLIKCIALYQKENKKRLIIRNWETNSSRRFIFFHLRTGSD